MRVLAERLERGSFDGRVARILELAYARAATRGLVKALRRREGARVVAIGGATLGGSGKTPLAIACARVLAETGASVTIVGHAYGASPGRARVVRADDPVHLVGDEALVCARALSSAARVVVGPTRQAALDLALAEADVAILDGVHQTAPRASLALLALDPAEPWGAGACPPRGDLRAPKDALLRLADRVIVVRATSRGAWHEGALVPWEDLRGRRIGLVTALARPDRVARTLAAHGIDPAVVRTFSDHARPRLRPVCGVDLWLATAKCAAALVRARERANVDVAVLDHQVVLDPESRLTLTRAGTYARSTP